MEGLEGGEYQMWHSRGVRWAGRHSWQRGGGGGGGGGAASNT